MSTYTDISKRVGWDSDPVEIPTKAEADTLLDKVWNKQCKESFEQVFRVYRFSEQPINDDQHAALETVYEAYRIGAQLFK